MPSIVSSPSLAPNLEHSVGEKPSKKIRSDNSFVEDEKKTEVLAHICQDESETSENELASDGNDLAVDADQLHDESQEENDDHQYLGQTSFAAWLIEQRQCGITPYEVLARFGLTLSKASNHCQDQLWSILLSMGVRLLEPLITGRKKIETVNTIEDITHLLQISKKIIVLTGAGISVSCGIPDFRSSNGIYSRLAEYNLPNPQCMFDLDFFRSNPKPFFSFAKELLRKPDGESFQPSISHKFIKLLEDKGKLLRNYSQNVDMLEHAAGISSYRSMLCHGSFETATCLVCRETVPGSSIWEEIESQSIPICKTCQTPQAVLKPDIVFFGEALPARFHTLLSEDQNEADLVIVMGSSLKVNPVRSIVSKIPPEVPMILINREVIGQPHSFDVELLGNCDTVVAELCRRLDWECDFLTDLGVQSTSYEFQQPCRYLFEGAQISEVEESKAPVDDAISSD